MALTVTQRYAHWREALSPVAWQREGQDWTIRTTHESEKLHYESYPVRLEICMSYEVQVQGKH